MLSRHARTTDNVCSEYIRSGTECVKAISDNLLCIWSLLQTVSSPQLQLLQCFVCKILSIDSSVPSATGATFDE